MKVTNPKHEAHLISCETELNKIPLGEVVYLDFETTSGDPKIESTDPWNVKHCKPCGIGITFDDSNVAYYIDTRKFAWEVLQKFLIRVFTLAEKWVNQGIKYDAHVLWNQYGLDFTGKIVDVMNLAKILDLNLTFKGGYALENLAKLWLKKDIYWHKEKMAPYLSASKDYGDIPLDVISPYGCDDVLTARELYEYINENMPKGCYELVATEIKFTRALIEIEREGLLVDVKALMVAEYQAMSEMLEIECELQEKYGYCVNPVSSKDCFDLICNRYCMPVLKYTNTDKLGNKTDKSNESFDKNTLRQYKLLPNVPKSLQETLDLMLRYRELSTLKGLFYEPWQKQQQGGRLHSNYNQNVRTGRLSCSNPNAQQMNKEVKGQILCPEGWAMLSLDYSQIEYRLMCHYCENESALEMYNANPETDFHYYIQESLGITRRPAKTINFMVGFGGGKNKTVNVVSATIFHEQPEIGIEGAKKLGRETFDNWHALFPENIPTRKETERLCKKRGYVRNVYGRRLRLDEEFAFRAFPYVVQSTASDLAKRRIVSREMQACIAKYGLKIIALVHDEVLFLAPTTELAKIEEIGKALKKILENHENKLKVPVIADLEVSFTTWKDCKPLAELLTTC